MWLYPAYSAGNWTINRGRGLESNMNTYGMDDFLQEYWSDLNKFFRRVFNKTKTDKNVVFVSRKAYCLFLLFKEKGYISDEGFRVYSDRYLMKNLDSKLFENQSVFLVDDTISTGRHMYDICSLIFRKLSCVTVHPMVFMKDDSFADSHEILGMFRQEGIEIDSQLCRTSSDVLKFCSQETLIFHRECMPYAVELPYLCENVNGQYYDYLTLGETEFQKLKKGTASWLYIECEQAGYMHNDILNAVLIMKDSSLAIVQSNLVQDFTVRLQITKSGSYYKIVILPFAILKSINFDELYDFFMLLYGNTEYGKLIKEYLHQGKQGVEEDIYVAIYRGLVFNFSYYIGKCLINYMERIFPHKLLSFSKKNVMYNFDKVFLDSTDEMFKDGKYSDYLQNVLSFSGFSPINVANNLTKYMPVVSRTSWNKKTVFWDIINLVNNIKVDTDYANNLKIQVKQKNKFITIEDLFEVFYDTYPLRGISETEELDDIMVSSICAMLEQSKLANEIYFEKESRVIYRGFKYGENSSALLDIPSMIFYVAVKQFYENAGFEVYRKNYKRFLSSLLSFLREYRFLGTIFSKEEFLMLSWLFEGKDQRILEKNIEDLHFIITDEMPYFMEQLKKNINQSDIYMI